MLYHFRMKLRSGEAHECTDLSDIDAAKCFAASWGQKYAPGDVLISTISAVEIEDSNDGLRGPRAALGNMRTVETVLACVWVDR